MMSPRDARALRIGALAASAVLIVRFGLIPATGYLADLSEEATHVRAQLQRDRAVIAQAHALASDTSLSWSKEVQQPADPMLMQAVFNEKFAAIAAGWEVELASPVWPPLDSTRGTFRSMRAQLVGRADFQGLLGFLWTMEESAELMVVESVDIIVEQTATDTAEEVEILRWSATVAVYFDSGVPTDSHEVPEASPLAASTKGSAMVGDR